MFKKIIITYYAASYLRFKNSKNEHGGYWLSAFILVSESAFAFLVVIDVLNYGIFGIDGIFGVRPILNKATFLLVFAIIPTVLLYYLIFHKYGVDKNATDEDLEYLNIDKRKRVAAMSFAIFINVLMLLLIYLFSSHK